MAAKIVLNPAQAAPAICYCNHAVRVGDWLFRAGQNPPEPATGNIQTQTGQVMAKVKCLWMTGN